ncbi:hypothetical protein BV20DRAFT_1004948 [Pilatotrama ljubarskyi]|nr:hypothetical protein BV20DRAFT_1004948 [Pilatotrama ljubarskyi]
MLDVFWALVDLAGYHLVPAEVVNSAWPHVPADEKQVIQDRIGQQLKVPQREDTPMPLDVVISLYLGFATPQELQELRCAFAHEDEPHVAIGKAVLPPYDIASDAQRSVRISVIYQLLREVRAFQFVFEPRWPTDDQDVPPYSQLATVRKLMHWDLEMERRIRGARPAHTEGSRQETPAEVAAKIVRAQNELRSLIRPTAAFKLSLRLAPEIIDPVLTLLDRAIRDLDEFPFIDLAFLPLTASQVIDLIRGFPGVETLSLSHNRFIRADDIPVIVASMPSLKRLHIMGFCSSLDYDLLAQLLRTQPLVFRNLESLLTPSIINLLPTDYPAAFAFQHLSRASTGRSPAISLPFFTPEQVLRALVEVVPLALREYQYAESAQMLAKSDGSIKGPRYGPLNMSRTKLTDGTPFYMNVAMLIHASFSSGVRAPGTGWCDRPIVSLPLQYASYSRARHGTWVFVFDWDHTRHRYPDSGTNAYGFVYYERGGSGMPTPSIDLLNDVIPGFYHFVGHTYDLRGFLRCMADEGRPLPSPEVVQTLERILDTRDPATLEKVCRLMSQDEVPHAVSANSQGELTGTLREYDPYSLPEPLKPVGQDPPLLWAARSSPNLSKGQRMGILMY